MKIEEPERNRSVVLTADKHMGISIELEMGFMVGIPPISFLRDNLDIMKDTSEIFSFARRDRMKTVPFRLLPGKDVRVFEFISYDREFGKNDGNST